MIIIRHNFDETKFKWLWAKYVRAGVLEKHCTASIPGVYSRKFSGTSNNDLLSQPELVMDEVPEDRYEAIYFCGVLKAGYLNKNPLKNNYRHNVHFAVLPKEGEHDVWDFENWHVEIEGGKLERIPAVYELGERFFKTPYDSHYYTCRIFRWMVGHFYPEELRDLTKNYPVVLETPEGSHSIETEELIYDLIRWGKEYVKNFLDSEDCWGFYEDLSIKNAKLKYGLINRIEFADYISENMGFGCGAFPLEIYSDFSYEGGMVENEMIKFIEIGIEEELDNYFPYQERRIINIDKD